MDKQTALYGKLPLHGDFVYRDFPADPLHVWDNWLQGFISGSQERLNDLWLDIYLTSPIWRFAFSPGILNGSVWLGCLMPSVDKVGRYFPISCMIELNHKVNPIEMLNIQTDWFENIEQLMLSALEGELDIDQLQNEANQIFPVVKAGYLKNPQQDISLQLKNAVAHMEFEEQQPSHLMPHFLDAFLSDSLASFSIWSSSGSELVEPSCAITQGLPKINQVTALLAGNWENWNWQLPYLVNTDDNAI